MTATEWYRVHPADNPMQIDRSRLAAAYPHLALCGKRRDFSSMVARKDYTCERCGRVIRRGTVYHFKDGRESRRRHLDCGRME